MVEAGYRAWKIELFPLQIRTFLGCINMVGRLSAIFVICSFLARYDGIKSNIFASKILICTVSHFYLIKIFRKAFDFYEVKHYLCTRYVKKTF